MEATTAAAVLEKQGPIALALVVFVVVFFVLLGAFLAYIKYNAVNTVPLSVYEAACKAMGALETAVGDSSDKITEAVNALALELARGGSR